MKINLPKEILIATHNKGKFVEIKDLLAQIGINSVSTESFNLVEPEETSGTFAGNALIKAKFYSKNTNLIALADDSGLCIEDLNGAPGVDSAPFAMDEKTGKKDFAKAFEKIKSLLIKNGIDPNSKPKAYFICNLCLFDPKQDNFVNFEGRVDGYLTFLEIENGVKGFGYDPIFVKNGMDKTFAQIDSKIKDEISHRGEAFKKMLKFFS